MDATVHSISRVVISLDVRENTSVSSCARAPAVLTLACPTELTARSGANLEMMLDALANLSTDTPVHLDLSTVSRVDERGLRCLLRGRRSLMLSGRRVIVSGATAHVRAVFEAAGQSVVLGRNPRTV